MNVPKQFLKSNEIDQEALKSIKAFYQKYSSSYKAYIKSPLKGTKYKQAVITWLFDLPKNVREQVCSIENKWVTLVIHQLYIQTLNKPKLRFILRDNASSVPFMDNPDLKSKGVHMNFQPDATHFLHYFAMLSENYETNCVDELIPLKFLNELQFYHNERNIIDYNPNNLIEYGQFDKKDYFCYFKLSRSIIFNKTNFLSYFNVLSNENLFKNVLELTPQGIDYPEWIKQPKGSNICYSISEIIAALFEQVISSKFIIANYGSGLFDILTQIAECMKLKKSLKHFLRNKTEENRYAYLHCEEIAKSVYYSSVIEKLIEAKTYNSNLSNRFTLYWENNASLDKVVKGVEKYMNTAIDEQTFIEKLLYRKIYQLYTQEDYYQRKVLLLLSSYYDQSYNEDLYNELMKPNESSNKNKKKKKKTKKKKNQKVDDVIQIDNKKGKVSKEADETDLQVISTIKVVNDKASTAISMDDQVSNKQRIFSFIKPKNSKSHLSNDSDFMPNRTKAVLSRFVLKDFMGVPMYINTYSPTQIMIKQLLLDIIDTIPIKDLDSIITTNASPESNSTFSSITLSNSKNSDDISSSTIESEPKQKKKKVKVFLYSTEPKKKKEPKKEKEKKKAFITILNNDILKFEENGTKILSLLANIKQAAIAKLKSQIQSIIITSYEIEIYGSYENGLSIEGSDIDVLIKTKKKVNLLTLMTHLSNYLAKTGEYLKVNPISTASVPVIKLIIDPKAFFTDSNLLSEYATFKESSYYQDYLFGKEELDYIKLDVTFAHSAKSITQNQVDYIKKALCDYPQIKPIIKIIKRILNLSNMNNSYTGGLSSYSIFLLVFAFQKSYTKAPISNCYSHLLLDFLNCYSAFDYYAYAIDVTCDYPFVKCLEAIESPPVILDPITKLNASKSSFKISEVKAIFLQCIKILNDIKSKYEEERNDRSSCDDENRIKLLMKIMK